MLIDIIVKSTCYVLNDNTCRVSKYTYPLLMQPCYITCRSQVLVNAEW
nr:MAG TPA: hypothetical protein [Ackermannviridae sp.]